MEHDRKSAHCTYDIKYPIVWITKYRKPVIYSSTGVCTSTSIRKQVGSVSKRKFVKKATDGIERIKETILGTASVGERVFCRK